MIRAQNEDLDIKENENNAQNSHFWTHPFFRQFLVLMSPVLIYFSDGLGFGSIVVMIPQIKANNTDIHLNPEIEAWLYAIHGVAALPAALVAPYLCHVKGYKFSFRITSLPVIISNIILNWATTDVQLLVAAILQSLTFGGNGSIVLTLVSEYSEPKFRGMFLVFKSASFFWGIWVANAVGSYASWRYIPMFAIWPPIIGLGLSFIWPESPFWLASKGMFEECRESFRWLRGIDESSEKELKLLTRPKTFRKHRNVFGFLNSTLQLRQFYMPLILSVTLFFVYQACGKFVCHMYILVIIKDITKDDSAAYTGMLIMDGVNVLGMYIGSYIAMKIPRRVMFFSATFSTIACLYIFSIYLYAVQYYNSTANNIVSLVILILFSFSVSWGPAILCPTFVAEICPMRFKPLIVSISLSSSFLLLSLFLRLAPWIFNFAGVNGTFAVYGTLTLIAALFLYKYLPETNKKTLEEIELTYESKNYRDNGPRSISEGEEMLRYT